jgi:glutamate-5-semialdehyde dehydrogenase
MDLTEQMMQLARRAKTAARQLSTLTSDEKNLCLEAMARAMDENCDAIRKANDLDMTAAAQSGLSGAMLDRLKLDEKRIKAMVRGLREVAALPDPVGRLLEERNRPNGLKLCKISAPIGVVVIIYESRPNVTADAASLCFKSGNATILRGGKEALHSNQAIARLMVEAARRASPKFPAGAVQVVSTPDREAIRELLSLTELVDLCMPRGGEGLIRAVTECSRVPVIKHYKGVCHVYVDGEADLEMAGEIAFNAKVQRPAVCNAMETLLIDRSVAAEFLPGLARRLAASRVALRVDAAARGLLKDPIEGLEITDATEEDWYREYNDLVLNIAIVDGLDRGIAHINEYGSGHSDCIVTRNETRAKRFLNAIDSAAVYWNASTRFTDGGEFGMGAEIGISTDKVGARGPMGLEELTTYKWHCLGTGQIRT